MFFFCAFPKNDAKCTQMTRFPLNFYFSPMFDQLDGKMQSFHHLSGSSEFLVVAELGGGGDDGASWQHSQLFRQSLKDTENTSFEVLVHFEDA